MLVQGCQPFQAAQIVPPYCPERESPAAGTHSRSVDSEELPGGPADPSRAADSEADTLLQEGSPMRNLTRARARPLDHDAGVADSPPEVVSADAGTHAVPAPSGCTHLATRDTAPVADIDVTASGVSGSHVQGDTLIEDAAGHGPAPSGAGRCDEEATSPCDSPGMPPPPADLSAGAAGGGGGGGASGDAGPGGDGSGGGGALREGSGQASLRRSDDGTEGDAAERQRRLGQFWDGEPDYFADMMGAEGGLFRGFGQQMEPAASPSAASDGREEGEGGASGAAAHYYDSTCENMWGLCALSVAKMDCQMQCVPGSVGQPSPTSLNSLYFKLVCIDVFIYSYLYNGSDVAAQLQQYSTSAQRWCLEVYCHSCCVEHGGSCVRSYDAVLATPFSGAGPAATVLPYCLTFHPVVGCHCYAGALANEVSTELYCPLAGCVGGITCMALSPFTVMVAHADGDCRDGPGAR